MFLRFFRFGIFTFEVGERHVHRLVTEADLDGTHSPTWASFRLADHSLRSTIGIPTAT